MDRVVSRRAHDGQDVEIARDAEQAQADDEQAGTCSAAEGDVQCRVNAPGRRLSGAHIGPDRDVHADITGETGEQGADRETDRGSPVEGCAENHEYDDANEGDRHVLAIHVRFGTFLDRRSDFLHAVGACRLGENPFCRYRAKYDGQQAGADREPQG